MLEYALENNRAKILGKIVSEPVFSHESSKEKFYVFYLESTRKSDTVDTIPIVISEKLLPTMSIKLNQKIAITGQLRTHNHYENGLNKLLVFIFVLQAKEVDEDSKDYNYVSLNGFVCKKPIYRETPFGREITDILLAVNRSYDKADYIPCILWGRNAKYTSTFNIGQNALISGRIQSRNYQKKLEDGSIINKITYELSTNTIEIVE